MSIPLPKVSATIRARLVEIGVNTVDDLARVARQQVADLAGVGVKAMLTIDDALHANDVRYSDEQGAVRVYVRDRMHGSDDDFVPVFAHPVEDGAFRLPDVGTGQPWPAWEFPPGSTVRVEVSDIAGMPSALVAVERVLQPSTLTITVRPYRRAPHVFVTGPSNDDGSAHTDHHAVFDAWLANIMGRARAEFDRLPRFPQRVPFDELADMSDAVHSEARFSIHEGCSVSDIVGWVRAAAEGLPITVVQDS